MRKATALGVLIVLAAISLGADRSRTWKDQAGNVLVRGTIASQDTESILIAPSAGGLDRRVKHSQLSAIDRAYLEGLADGKALALGDGKVDPTPDIVGEVVGITDGDTITVKDDANETHKVRLEGIDAPEASQGFGTQAKKALSEKVFGKEVRVDWSDLDKYSRILGHVYLGKRHINEELLNDGMAWHYKAYNSDAALARAELKAKERRIGLWKEPHPVAPWDYRHGVTTGEKLALGTALAASSPEIASSGSKPRYATPRAELKPTAPDLRSSAADPKVAQSAIVYVTKTGSKYHLSGCRHLSKSKIPISLEDAKKRYGACSVCDPP